MSATATMTSSASGTIEIPESICQRQDDISSQSVVPGLEVIVGRIRR